MGHKELRAVESVVSIKPGSTRTSACVCVFISIYVRVIALLGKGWDMCVRACVCVCM